MADGRQARSGGFLPRLKAAKHIRQPDRTASLFSLGVSMIEFFGGVLLVLGLFTRLASLGALIVLLNTVYFHWVVFGEGFQGAEYSILWATVAFFFLIRGGDAHSVDAKLPRSF